MIRKWWDLRLPARLIGDHNLKIHLKVCSTALQHWTSMNSVLLDNSKTFFVIDDYDFQWYFEYSNSMFVKNQRSQKRLQNTKRICRLARPCTAKTQEEHKNQRKTGWKSTHSTPPKTNMESENSPLEKEKHLPTTNHQFFGFQPLVSEVWLVHLGGFYRCFNPSQVLFPGNGDTLVVWIHIDPRLTNPRIHQSTKRQLLNISAGFSLKNLGKKTHLCQ